MNPSMPMVHGSMDKSPRRMQSHKSTVVFFIILSILAGLITLASLRGMTGMAMPVKQFGILVVIISAMASTMAWTHFIRRNRVLPRAERPDFDLPEDPESSAQRRLLDPCRLPEVPITGNPKRNAAALSHYLHEMNCELVKSVAAHMNERPQKRKLLGD